MIDFQTYMQIRCLADEQGLKAAQIARSLNLDERTVAHWIEHKTYHPPQRDKKASKLDPHKGQIIRLLESHPYSAQQVFQLIGQEGYTGGYGIVKAFVREVRPAPRPAFLSLHFDPGQCAQVDWGHAGLIQVGSVKRHLSFFVMVLAFSRRMYVQFTLAQTQEHWLACHQNAFEYFGGVTTQVMVDNCKTAVLSHSLGQAPIFNPRYVDFAQHHGFIIKACGPKKPHEKGRVENGVGYIRKNFLAGMQPASLDAINAAVRGWLDNTANLRVHGETRKTPMELFLEEAPKLRPLHPTPYETACLHTLRSNNRCRVHFDGNRYSIPPNAASQSLVLKAYPERIGIYCKDQLIAEHPRCYDRHQTIENPDHSKDLLAHRHQARDQRFEQRFLALGSPAQTYYEQLAQRYPNPKHHVQKIMALVELYGAQKVLRAIEDAIVYNAFSYQYIANILEQRQRPIEEPGALHLTRQSDLLELDLPEPDLSLYNRGGEQ
jgi:transposase